MTSFNDLCIKYDTDKSSKHHNFCNFYDRNLNLNDASSLLEVGVLNGSSIKSWTSYMPDADIVGMDIKPMCYGKCLNGFPNVNIEYTDQDSKQKLKNSIKNRKFDIIVDDGGHTMKQQQNTLYTYWDYVNPGGAFIMEDLHTSHKPQYYNDGYRNTTELILDPKFSLPNLNRINCNFNKNDWKNNDHMTCILHKK